MENIRREVMEFIEKDINKYMDKYLLPVTKIWQPSDLLPQSYDYDFFISQVKEIREISKDMPDDLWITLVGDMITEEALPTYESWLMQLDGIKDGNLENGWYKWIRHWTGEENRHGDVLNKYLYLTGKIDMKKVEISTHYLINDGFDIGTSHDPYKNFVYTSFQELATYISHDNVALLAKKYDNHTLYKMCRIIAGDEMRHHLAYVEFVRRILEIDPSNMIIAIEYMFKLKIIMPAHFLRNIGFQKGDLFSLFSDAAQRIGVYTVNDYIYILEKLIKDWNIENIEGLNDSACRSRDYILKLPIRMKKIADRYKSTNYNYDFTWILKR